MISTFFGILLGILATIFGCAFLALESIQLAIAVVLYSLASKKLVVVSFWNRINFVRSIGIWFRKSPKQPGKSKGRIITFEHGVRGFTKVSAYVGGRVSKHTGARKRGRPRPNTILVALLIWNLGVSILQLYFQYRYKLARESARFFRLTMDSARENDSKGTDILGTESTFDGHSISSTLGHDVGPIFGQVDQPTVGQLGQRGAGSTEKSVG